jgi:hypothetical protein
MDGRFPNNPPSITLDELYHRLGAATRNRPAGVPAKAQS